MLWRPPPCPLRRSTPRPFPTAAPPSRRPNESLVFLPRVPSRLSPSSSPHYNHEIRENGVDVGTKGSGTEAAEATHVAAVAIIGPALVVPPPKPCQRVGLFVRVRLGRVGLDHDNISNSTPSLVAWRLTRLLIGVTGGAACCLQTAMEPA